MLDHQGAEHRLQARQPWSRSRSRRSTRPSVWSSSTDPAGTGTTWSERSACSSTPSSSSGARARAVVRPSGRTSSAGGCPAFDQRRPRTPSGRGGLRTPTTALVGAHCPRTRHHGVDGVQGARRWTVDRQEEGPHAPAHAAHHRCRGDVVARGVADHEREASTVERDGVVPVAPHVVTAGRRQVPRRQLDPGARGQRASSALWSTSAALVRSASSTARRTAWAVYAAKARTTSRSAWTACSAAHPTVSEPTTAPSATSGTTAPERRPERSTRSTTSGKRARTASRSSKTSSRPVRHTQGAGPGWSSGRSAQACSTSAAAGPGDRAHPAGRRFEHRQPAVVGAEVVGGHRHHARGDLVEGAGRGQGGGHLQEGARALQQRLALGGRGPALVGVAGDDEHEPVDGHRLQLVPPGPPMRASQVEVRPVRAARTRGSRLVEVPGTASHSTSPSTASAFTPLAVAAASLTQSTSHPGPRTATGSGCAATARCHHPSGTWAAPPPPRALRP